MPRPRANADMDNAQTAQSEALLKAALKDFSSQKKIVLDVLLSWDKVWCVMRVLCATFRACGNWRQYRCVELGTSDESEGNTAAIRKEHHSQQLGCFCL